MSGGDGLSRRTILATPALLAFATPACGEPGVTSEPARSTILVAYLTRSGNTRVIAETLGRMLAADRFEIRTARPYPEDYEEHVAQATRERDGGIEPALAERVANIADYEEIYLGFPIWGGTIPAPIRSFLNGHNLTGKTVHPFITHGGYGIGNSQAVLAGHLPAAQLEEAFVMEADQERRTLNEVRGWIDQVRGAGSQR